MFEVIHKVFLFKSKIKTICIKKTSTQLISIKYKRNDVQCKKNQKVILSFGLLPPKEQNKNKYAHMIDKVQLL